VAVEGPVSYWSISSHDFNGHFHNFHFVRPAAALPNEASSSPFPIGNGAPHSASFGFASLALTNVAIMKKAISIRFAEEADQKYLVEWLLQPGVLEWFPLADIREIEDAARIWLAYAKQDAVLTALWDGVPCGIANLYLQPYKKLAHQCLFAIVVDEKYRGKGVGTKLMGELMALAKDTFKIELLHLEVYEGNPAKNLYDRLGFEQYGIHRRFIKSDGKYQSKVLMQKKL